MRSLFGACNIRRAHQCLTPCVAPAGHLYGHNSYFITIVFFWKFSWSNARWVLFHKWMSIGRWWSRPHLESDTHQSSLWQHLHMITVWQLTIIPMCCVEAHIHILTFPTIFYHISFISTYVLPYFTISQSYLNHMYLTPFLLLYLRN